MDPAAVIMIVEYEKKKMKKNARIVDEEIGRSVVNTKGWEGCYV